MPRTPHIVIVVASTRTTRFADVPLKWLQEQTASNTDLSFEVLDLRDHPLPFYDLPASPGMARREYASDAHRNLGAIIDAADGFLVITNEYNHGYSAALKNVLDHFFAEFNRKPISFIGYGSAGGARAIEQLRQVAAELELASVRPTVNIFGHQMMAMRDGGDIDAILAPQVPRLEALLNDLHWWATALTTARAADKEETDASDEAA